MLTTRISSLLLLALPIGVAAQSHPPVPNLVGVWTSRITKLEITRQQGALLWAVNTWNPTALKSGKPGTALRRNAMLGSLNPNGTGGVLTTEATRFAFTIRNEDELDAELVRFVPLGATQPTAFYATFVRKRHTVAAPAAKAPSLLGSWRGRYRYAQGPRALESEFELDVVKQEGPLIWVDDVWRPMERTGTKAQEAPLRRDRMEGSLSPDGRHGLLAKEHARYALSLNGHGDMEVEFVRMGGAAELPTAFYAVLQRNGIHPLPFAKKAPDLRGVWEGDYRYAQPKGPLSAHFQIEITKQDGVLLWGDDVWHSVNPATGKVSKKTRRDPLVGSLRPEGGRGVLTKAGARFAFTIESENRILVQFERLHGEGQQPMAFYCTLTRH